MFCIVSLRSAGNVFHQVGPGVSLVKYGEMFFLEKCMYSIVHELYCEHM